MKLFSVVVAAVAFTCGKADEEVSTERVTAKFLGASGGMRLCVDNDTQDCIQIDQDKLEEVNADGSNCQNDRCFKLNPTGGRWTELTKEETDEGSVHKTQYSVTGKGGELFTLQANVFSNDINTTVVVPCTTCSENSEGKCMNAEGMCADFEFADNQTCADGFTACTENITGIEDSLEFSILLENVDFRDASNNIVYAINVKDKGGNTDSSETTEDEDGQKKTSVSGGSITYPSTGTVYGTDGTSREVNITSTVSTQGSKTVVSFVFPSFELGESLFVDPTLQTDNSAALLQTSAVLSLLCFVSYLF